MCKGCGYDPYLAGRIVIFELPPSTTSTFAQYEEYGKWVEVQSSDRPRGYTGVCVSHHKGWVTIRTKKDTYSFPEEKVLAYKEDMT